MKSRTESPLAKSFFVAVMIASVVIIYVYYTLDGTKSTNTTDIDFCTRNKDRESGIFRHSCVSNLSSPTLSGNSRMTIFPGDVIPENIALQFPPCTDADVAADANHSVVFATDQKLLYKQGETISVSIDLYDGKGRQKTVGGDQLRARIMADNKTSIVTGIVFDHDNGSYTAQFEALFEGEIIVDVKLAYTRESISSIYRVQHETSGTYKMEAKFINVNTTEETVCHTFPERVPNASALCNLTFENSGDPWYCGKPENSWLMCSDWAEVRNTPHPARFPVTAAETVLLERKMRSIPNDITITVEATEPNILNPGSSLVPCNKYDTERLWYKREPTGYFHKGQWRLRHCQGKSLSEFKTCIGGKNILLHGDSTTRQWFEEIAKTFGCYLVSEPWNTAKWHKRADCASEEFNFTASWIPHNQPFFLGIYYDTVRYTTYSLSRHIDELVSDDDDVIVLLHFYIHVHVFQSDVFETKAWMLRRGVEKLIARNRHAKIFIKAPHTFHQVNTGLMGCYDYVGHLYTNIWYRVFEGLHDRVIFLDQKDITNAYDSVPLHPHNGIVSDMIAQMLSYIC